MRCRFRRATPLVAFLSFACSSAPAPDAASAPRPVPTPNPALDDPGSSPELEAGRRVVDIRLGSEPIVLAVGESVDIRDLQPTPVDADGLPVSGATLLASSVSGREATLEQSIITGREEGETQLVLAVMQPDASGQSRPAIFPVPIVVRGRPVETLRIVPPERTVYTRTSVPLSVEARTRNGTLRTLVDVEWTSRNPDIASVTDGGIVRGYRPGMATILASVEGVDAAHLVEVQNNPVRSIELTPDNASVRAGDVVRFEATPRDRAGRPVTDVDVEFAVGGGDGRGSLGASVFGDGTFVADRPGSYSVVTSVGGVSATAVVEARTREVGEEPVRVGLGMIPGAPGSDLWVFEGLDGRDYAYVGTHVGGRKMFAWDVTDPSAPSVTDSVVVDTRVVNDVKVNPEATLAVITLEGASDQLNGIMLLDLVDPAHPSVLTTYADGLTGGVQNAFIEGELVYAVHDGTSDVHIIDISDPTAPRESGRWGIDSPGKRLHDFWIVAGLGYASYGSDGVWIVDVGDGRWGGTPTEPVTVSSYAYPEGNTHVALPYTNSDGRTYLFTGDEILDCEECVARSGTPEDGPRGFIHVFAVDDPENPVEVARYEVPEAGTHNIWADDDRLYVAYSQGGLRVVDVSGELRGDLYEQGREVAWFPTGHPAARRPNSPMAWGARPYRGNVFVSDMHSGLWVVRLVPLADRPDLP